jgi:hypothetical protein
MNEPKLVAIFTENKPGQMARMTGILAEAAVNIRWTTIATSETFGVVKFLVDQADLARERLKAAGFMVSLVDVLAIEVSDQPGGLHLVADCLAQNGINMENSSGFVFNRRAILLVEVKDLPKARDVLVQRGLRLLSQEEALQI